MPVLVMKFGGTSVGDLKKISNVANIVKKNLKGSKLIVVLSAMAGETNKMQNYLDSIKSEEKIENDPKYDDLPYMERIKAVKKALGPITAKHLKKYIDTTNKLLKSNKKKVVANLTKASNETNSWWNEILIYNVKVKDVFVLKRVWDDYYFQNDSGYNDDVVQSYKKDLLDYVDEKDITVGTPAQFRKWYTARKGEITV